MSEAAPARSKRDKPVPKHAYGRRVLARLYDGVLLLEPANKPVSFTNREIKATIRKVLRDLDAAAEPAGAHGAR